MKSKILLSSLLVIAIVLSGCATITVDTKVRKDGSIERTRMVVNTSSLVYGFLVESAKKKGYSSLRESFMASVGEDMKDKVSYNEVWHGDQVSIIIEAVDYVPKEGEKLTIKKENGYLIYQDLTFLSDKAAPSDEFSKAIMGTFSLHYYLEMPGKIVDSNANVVKENKAEWHLVGTDAFNAKIYAKSEIPALPGFELPLALLAVILVLIVSGKQWRK